MAAFTSKATGNWSASGQTTWNEVGVPGTGDTASFSAGHVVTMDGNTTCGAIVIGGGVGEAELVLGAFTLTLQGQMQVGSGTNAEVGKLTLGAGCTLAMGANNVQLLNAVLRSTSTTGNWATVTGSGSVVGGGAPQPGMDIVLNYVSWQNTGTVLFECGVSRVTGITQQLDFQLCAFVGNGTITFGQASGTALSTPQVVDNCDFREQTGNPAIVFAAASGDSTGPYSFSRNTCSHASAARNIQVKSKDGLVATNNVFNNFNWGIGFGHTAGDLTLSHTFATRDSGLFPDNLIAHAGGEDADTTDQCYIYAPWENAHPFVVVSTGGSGEDEFTGNVLDVVFHTDDADILVFNASTKSVTLSRNLLIGAGNLSAMIGPDTVAGITVDHNTVYVSDAAHLNYPTLFLIKTGLATGPVSFRSNLVSAVGTMAKGLHDLDNTPAQEIIADYNNFDDVTTPYDRIQAIGTSNDQAVPPQFVDNSRNLATWTAGGGIGSPSVANAITYLLLMNGYNSTTKTQSDTPSAQIPSDLVTWVKAGFAPQNAALKNAGHDGATPGAVEYSALATGETQLTMRATARRPKPMDVISY